MDVLICSVDVVDGRRPIAGLSSNVAVDADATLFGFRRNGKVDRGATEKNFLRFVSMLTFGVSFVSVSSSVVASSHSPESDAKICCGIDSRRLRLRWEGGGETKEEVKVVPATGEKAMENAITGKVDRVSILGR